MKRVLAIVLLPIAAAAGLVGLAIVRPASAPSFVVEPLSRMGLLARPAAEAATRAEGDARGAPAAAPAPGAGPARPPASVETAIVKVDTVSEQVVAVGSLRADEQVTIASEIAGRIAEIAVEGGTRVEAGDVLFRIDDTILRAELARAEAELELAESNFQRADTLAAQRSGTVRARDEAFAALQQGRAATELARAQLSKTVIDAPFGGVVGLRGVSAGEYINPGDPLIALSKIDLIEVDFRVPEIYLSRVREGQSIAITVDALPGENFTGEIYAIDPQIDVNGRAIRLRARVPNPDAVLRPGLFARVNITTAERVGSIIVPESAIVPEGEQRFVYKIEGGTAVRVAVTLGQRRRGEVEILEGLAPDDVVVTAGQQRLRDGAPVRVAQRDARV